MTKHIGSFLSLIFCMALLMSAAFPVQAKGKDEGSPQASFIKWRAADDGFAAWDTSQLLVSPTGLTMNPAMAQMETDPYPAGGYYVGNFYTGGSYWVVETISPELVSDFTFVEAIASWNALTPSGTWVETQIRANLGDHWTKWYNLGVWAEDTSTIQRHSVKLQGDADGYVAVDTLVISAKKAQAVGYQLKIRLFSLDPAISPVLINASLTYTNAAARKASVSAGDPALWNTLIDVPQCSQMIYPDGGTVWCSPTSTSMVLGYWQDPTGPCEPRVYAAVNGVFDWIYDGHGNWPFNTAYAAAHGMEAYVTRFTSLAQAEPWIAAGIPVVVSFSWGKNDLTGSPIPASGGHLAVLVGFDEQGNPIVNDPAAASDAEVRRTYLRSEFEPLWLSSSGGTVYLIYPPGTALP